MIGTEEGSRSRGTPMGLVGERSMRREALPEGGVERMEATMQT